MATSTRSSPKLVTGRPPAVSSWLEPIFASVAEATATPQLARAATLVRAASRVVLTGSGRGIDPAAFGVEAFTEVGVDAASVHAGELNSGHFRLQPGDLVVGIDTDSSTVAGALRRARLAGLRSIGVTSRELTVIDADVLLYLPDNGQLRPGPLPTLIAKALLVAGLAARLASRSQLAEDLERAERDAQHMMSAAGRLMATVLFGSTADSRAIFAGSGAACWTASGLARQCNQTAPERAAPHAISANYQDILDGLWRFERTDTLILIDPEGDPRQPPVQGPDRATLPPRTWVLGRSKPMTSDDILLPSASPALSALSAFIALSAQLEFASNSVLGPSQGDV